MDQRTHEKIAPHLGGGFTFGTPVLEGELLAIVPTTHILDVNASKEPRR